jgi:glycine betaine/proline transport system substrate-binding protein
MTGKFKAFGLIILVLFAFTLFAGCTGSENTGQTEGQTTVATPTAGTESKGDVSIGYVLWDSEIASTNVLTQVFEKAGYDVELYAVDAGPLYQALAKGDVDLSVSAWLPSTQENYWTEYGDDIDLVRKNMEGTKIGLVVPTYVTIDSIDELNGVADKFDNTITGIEPGAGIMQNTEDAIEEYGLDYTLLSSSSAGMTAELSKAYKDEDWIVVTGWTPHWMFSRYDLKYLDDPKGVFGGDEYIGTLARTGLKEDKPEVYAILEKFNWTADDMSSVMLEIEGGASEEEAAAAWIKANEETVNSWIS